LKDKNTVRPDDRGRRKAVDVARSFADKAASNLEIAT
jgi:hypothetical protein